MMKRPDFAKIELERLEDRDLRYIIEHFPLPGRSYEEIARMILTLPSTLESLLSSEYLYRKIYEREELILQISPFLFFNVLLRRAAKGSETRKDRKIINYIANLLSIFIRTERLYKVELHDTLTTDYMFELITQAASADPRRQFLIYSHIGNFSLFITGLFPQWVEYRHRFKKRPLNLEHYVNYGRTYFQRASEHPMAREFGLDDVFLRMAMLFEVYKDLLNDIARNHLVSLRS